MKILEKLNIEVRPLTEAENAALEDSPASKNKAKFNTYLLLVGSIFTIGGMGAMVVGSAAKQSELVIQGREFARGGVGIMTLWTGLNPKTEELNR